MYATQHSDCSKAILYRDNLLKWTSGFLYTHQSFCSIHPLILSIRHIFEIHSRDYSDDTIYRDRFLGYIEMSLYSSITAFKSLIESIHWNWIHKTLPRLLRWDAYCWTSIEIAFIISLYTIKIALESSVDPVYSNHVRNSTLRSLRNPVRSGWSFIITLITSLIRLMIESMSSIDLIHWNLVYKISLKSLRQLTRL